MCGVCVCVREHVLACMSVRERVYPYVCAYLCVRVCEHANDVYV